MNRMELGLRLKSIREFRGLSQRSVADALNLPRTAITQLETGNRSVSTLELTKLAKLYLCPITDLLQDKERDGDKDVLLALYRAVPKLKKDSFARDQIALCTYLCAEGVVLRHLLGYDHQHGPPNYKMHHPRSSADAVSQGEEVAVQERNRLSIAHTPIGNIPKLIATQGIWASEVLLPDSISGLFLRHPSVGLAILVNSSHGKRRKRFSYAHEYAHALLDRNTGTRISSTKNLSELVEKRANAFAAAFLMPRNGIHSCLRNLNKGGPSRQDHAVFDAASGGCTEATQRAHAPSRRITYNDIAWIADKFGTNYQAAVYRLKSLRYITNRECKYLLGQESMGREYLEVLSMFTDTDRDKEHHSQDRELRNEITYLAIEAYRRGEISRGKLLELSSSLCIDGNRLITLAKAARGE